MYSRLRSPERIDTERVRHLHPIAEVVADYGIELRRSGSALVGRCPFHADAGRPNLTVYPRSARFVCFRCHARGDAIAFVQQLEQLSFRDAVGRLSRGGALPASMSSRRLLPPRPLPRSLRLATPRTDEHKTVLAAAMELYANQLLSESAALRYLAQRGFSPPLIEQARLGYARGGELVPYLAWRGHSPRLARQLGLIRSDGRESFAGRVIVPELRDGRPVWMIGRCIGPGQPGPKYLGLPGLKPLLGWDDAQRACVSHGRGSNGFAGSS